MNKETYWAVVPAAGSGARFGASIPKQYLKLANKLVIEHTLNALLQFTSLEKIVVVIAENDTYWQSTEFALHSKIITTIGGNSRHLSVLNGLGTLAEYVRASDWVLVHDAARPCLKICDIKKLVQQLENHPIGGLLGAPVRDTLKYTNANGEVVNTIDRKQLWQAFTPQMFRYGKLLKALEDAQRTQQIVTDEASALELLGETPQMVNGRIDNIKITEPDDLTFAKWYLTSKE